MRQYHLAEYPQFLRDNFASKSIIRYQERGNASWKSLTGEEFAEECLRAAKGLACEGISTQERVGIYSANSVWGLASEIGLYMMRGVSVPLYATSPPEQVAYIVRNADIHIIFVGDQFQYNNAFEVQRTEGILKRIIVFDRAVVFHPEDSTSTYYDEFIRRADAKQYENIANVSISHALSTDLAVIIYTSGTSGASKGVPLNHANLIKQITEHIKMFSFLSSEDISMSFLPHSHIFEKIWVYYCLKLGSEVAILADPKKILQALPEVRPTMMCNVPRFWEKVYSGVQDKIAQSSPLAKKVFSHAAQIGYIHNLEYKNLGRKAPLHIRVMYWIYKRTLFSKIKKVIGIERGRFFPTAGASLSVDVNRFLQSVGIPICFGYGLSESSATVSCFPLIGFDITSVGKIVDHVEVRIDANTGEIQLKGPTIITGYYNNPEADAESFTDDGFFKTGDAGYIKDNVLYFTERIKDLFKTANGKYIAPQALEGLMTMNPLFEQVAIIGDGYKFVSALIYPNWDILKNQAQERGVNTSVSLEDLIDNHEVQRIVMAHIELALGSVAQYEKVKRFALLTKPFSIENGELTSTLKVRRKIVAEHYASTIAKIYAEF